ncbi:MAG: hypothetical protein ACJAXX_000369 [Roseivirga sp.]
MVKRNRLIKQIAKRIGQCLAVALVTILLFEGAFRLYVIDFYKSSFEHLNSDFDDRNTDKTLMIIGDSFSSFKEGYGKVLHDSLPEFKLRNMSVSGTSVREQYLFGRHHLKKEKPEILIFQFYVGNDFFGWDHSLNWIDISLTRNFYWQLSERLWSLSYINYSLGKLKLTSHEIDTIAIQGWLDKPYSPDLYSERDIMDFKSEPMLVENTLYLKGGREDNFDDYMERVAHLFDYAPEDCQIYFLIIPHKSQVSNRYKRQTEQIGAVFSSDFEVASQSYPLNIAFKNFFATDPRVKVLNTVNLLGSLEATGHSIYFNNDSHLNVLGQEAVGEFLLKQIKPNDQ